MSPFPTAKSLAPSDFLISRRVQAIHTTRPSRPLAFIWSDHGYPSLLVRSASSPTSARPTLTPFHLSPSDSAYAEDMYSGGVQRTPQNRAHSHSADQGSPSSSTLSSFEPVQRKRGKFTRSKTGCLTCRAKKVKVRRVIVTRRRRRANQSPAHPVRRGEARLQAVSRHPSFSTYLRTPLITSWPSDAPQCTWPENVPAKKRPTRRESMRQSGSPGQEMRPSTAGSSSEVSTPPGRMDTPPRQMSAKQPLSLPPHILVGPGTVQPTAPSQRQMYAKSRLTCLVRWLTSQEDHPHQ